jgi:hypothetical protein
LKEIFLSFFKFFIFNTPQYLIAFYPKKRFFKTFFDNYIFYVFKSSLNAFFNARFLILSHLKLIIPKSVFLLFMPIKILKNSIDNPIHIFNPLGIL